MKNRRFRWNSITKPAEGKAMPEVERRGGASARNEEKLRESVPWV